MDRTPQEEGQENMTNLFDKWLTPLTLSRSPLALYCRSTSSVPLPRSRMPKLIFMALIFAVGLILSPWASGSAEAQLLDPSGQSTAPNLLIHPTLTPGQALLFDLEAHFAKDVAQQGGKAFAEWFAVDGVSLSNGAKPVMGREAIAKGATWTSQQYQLTWTPTDAVMGPSGDMGYTWGHYEGRSTDANGKPVLVSGRYTTIWRRQKDGAWKVVLDVGSNEPAGAADCCKLPTGL